jgi:hypothetical protein
VLRLSLDDPHLFIGILPGADTRQVVLFPDGQVLADIREQEIQTGGYRGRDHGMIAASALIGLLRDSGWCIDEMPHAGAVWMKPCRPVPATGEALEAGPTDDPDASLTP